MDKPRCGTCAYWDNYDVPTRVGVCRANGVHCNSPVLDRENLCSKHDMFKYYLKSLRYKNLKCDSCVHITGCEIRESESYTVCCTKHQGLNHVRTNRCRGYNG